MRGVVLASIGLGALLGIVVLLGADIGEPGGKVIASSFMITGAALVSMPPVAAWERGRLGSLPVAGVAATVVGFGWLILMIWIEPDFGVLWKLPFTLIIVGIAIAGVALMEFARLEPQHSWLLAAVRISIGVVAVLLTIGMWGEIDGGGYWRTFGVTAVLLAAFLAAVPVLHRSSRAMGAVAGFCPLCGATNRVTTGVATVCDACGGRYSVDVGSASSA